jgi:hypothetical protein
MKPQLLVLKQLLSDDATIIRQTLNISREDARFIRRTAERFLGHIEHLLEHVAAKTQPREAYQILGHSVIIENFDSPIQLKVYYPKRNRQGAQKHHHRIALLLQLDQLGPVRIDLACVGNQLQIHFFLQDDAARALVTSHMDEVRQALSATFDHIQLNVAVSRDYITRFQDEDLNDASHGRIDLKA